MKILAHYDQRRAAYLAEVKALEALGDDLSNEILKRLKTKEALGPLGFDALLIAQGDPLLRSLGPLLPYYEIDPQTVQFLGTGLWDEPSLVREPPLRGAWFPAPEPSVPRAFLARFEQAYGRPAPRLATLGYDGMALLATLARNPVQSERFEAAAFEDRAGFSGLMGLSALVRMELWSEIWRFWKSVRVISGSSIPPRWISGGPESVSISILMGGVQPSRRPMMALSNKRPF